MSHGLKQFINKCIGEYGLAFFAVVILCFVIIGTLLFHIVEGWKLFDAFYFTTVTMATVGYGDIFPITHTGKVLSIIYGFMGAPLFIGLTSIFFQSKFQKIIKRSIHSYHKEIKETEVIALQNKAAIKKQKKDIEAIQEEVQNN